MPPKSLAIGEWNLRYQTQDIVGHVYKLRGSAGMPAEIENAQMIFRAEEIDFDQDTGDVRASGHVYFHNFERNMKMWCDHLTYNTDEETGKFYDVTGETRPHLVAKPGMLTTDNPFHFEGEWAERVGAKYVLHNGFITNCKMPRPWWRLRGKTFDILPGERAIAHNSLFLLRRMPLFYTPFFYHSLAKEPRKSGLLLPIMGHSSRHGWMIHAGYFWAINRSYDVTYSGQYYTSRGLVDHVDFRGKPRNGTDYDVILYGVQDRGTIDPGNPKGPLLKYSGLSLLAVGQSDLGKGWTARANVNYISSFRFRQEWSESYNDIIGSEIHSVGFVNKNWSSFTVNAILGRSQNFSSEINVAPKDEPPDWVANAVVVRKLPEVEFTSRNRRILERLPFYFSFDSSAGLLYRYEPVFNQDNNALIDKFQTGQFMNRSSIGPRVTGAFHWAGLHLVPSFGIQETYYGETQEPYLDRHRVVGTNFVRSSRDFSLDVILPSLARVFNKKTMFGDKLKHVIEPRATYRYVTGIGQDFNRVIRFDETDIWANTNELLLSIANRLYAKRGDSVEEIFSWEVFQKRYFDPTFGGAVVPGQRNVIGPTADLTAYAFLVGPRSTSPVVSVLRMSPVGGLGARWQADYDPRAGGVVDSSLAIDYRFARYFVSAGHDMVHTDPAVTAAANLFRMRGGFGDPNHRGFNAGVDAIYNHKTGKIETTTSQITYNTNCCGLSVQFHRFDVPSLRAPSNDFRVAFSVANISTTLGNLKKQDRMF